MSLVMVLASLNSSKIWAGMQGERMSAFSPGKRKRRRAGYNQAKRIYSIRYQLAAIGYKKRIKKLGSYKAANKLKLTFPAVVVKIAGTASVDSLISKIPMADCYIR